MVCDDISQSLGLLVKLPVGPHFSPSSILVVGASASAVSESWLRFDLLTLAASSNMDQGLF